MINPQFIQGILTKDYENLKQRSIDLVSLKQLPLLCLDHLGARKPASCAVAGSLKQISGLTFS